VFQREPPHLPALKLLLAVLLVFLGVLALPPRRSPEIVAYGLLALIAFFVLALAFVLVGLGVVHYRNWREPRKSVPAAVVRKWTRSYDYDAPAVVGGGSWLTMLIYLVLRHLRWVHGGDPTMTVYRQYVFWVSFRVGDRDLDFGVPEKVYTGLEDGQTGMLSYRGEKFLSFEPMGGWEEAESRVPRSEDDPDSTTSRRP
jgi:hypothetical protein